MSTSLQSENPATCGTFVGQKALLADRIVARHYSLPPDLASRVRCVADAKRLLEALSQAIEAGRSALFVDYVAWAKIFLDSRGIPAQDLADNLEACRQTLDDVLPPDQAALADQYLLDSLSRLPALPNTTPSYLGSDQPLADLARRYLAKVSGRNQVSSSNDVRETALVRSTRVWLKTPQSDTVSDRPMRCLRVPSARRFPVWPGARRASGAPSGGVGREHRRRLWPTVGRMSWLPRSTVSRF